MNLLFLIHGGTNSRDIFLDLLAGAREAGHQTHVLAIDHLMQIYLRTPGKQSELQADVCRLVAQFIRENSIDLTIAMWANALQLLGLTTVNGQNVTFFDAIQSPLLNFWLDAPERANAGSLIPHFRSAAFNSKNLFHLINNEATAEEMSQLFGFSNVLPIPYGINPTIFHPVETKKEYDISFSAGGGEAWTQPTPAMLEEVQKETPDLRRVREDLAQRIAPKLDAIARRFPAAPALRPALQAMVQFQLDDPTLTMVARLNAIAARSQDLHQAIETLGRNLPAYVETAQTLRDIDSFRRIFFFVHLTRHFNCCLYGKVDLSAWKCTVPSAGFVAYNEQAAQYNRAHLGLSIMRWQDEVGLHIKPFEITASGTACLAEHRAGIEKLWIPDEEILTFKSLPEAREKVAAVLKDPARLTQLAAAGHARTLRDHTWAKRMTLIPQVIEKIRTQK